MKLQNIGIILSSKLKLLRTFGRLIEKKKFSLKNYVIKTYQNFWLKWDRRFHMMNVEKTVVFFFLISFLGVHVSTSFSGEGSK